MDMFRAIVSREELSERVLDLTETLIRINPGHFTVWFVLFYSQAYGDECSDIQRQGVQSEDAARDRS